MSADEKARADAFGHVEIAESWLRSELPDSGTVATAQAHATLAVACALLAGCRRRDALLPEDPTGIAVVDDGRRDPWLTEDEKRQPRPPSKADIDAVIARRDARLALLPTQASDSKETTT